jgi:hypothetical protein
MKSHEAARISKMERIIDLTHQELSRPEVVDELGYYATRTTALVERLYVPHVVGGRAMVPPELRDSERIPVVLSRTSRRLSYPSETTPTQIRRAEELRADGWRDVSSDVLTDGELACIDNYPYETKVKYRADYYTRDKSERIDVAFAVAHTASTLFAFTASDTGIARKLEMVGKPIVTIDPSLTASRSSVFVASALIHELQHVDDALEHPVAVYAATDEARWSEDDALRSELRAYAVQAAYLGVRNADGEHVAEVEEIREWYNGTLFNSDDPFAPTWRIKRSLARRGLSHLY